MIIITEYVYIADGVKLKTIHRTAVEGATVSGSVPYLSEQNTLRKDSTLHVGAYELCSNSSDKYFFANGYIGFVRGRLDSYFYYAKDHLGNVRHVDRSTPGRDNGIVQITNYYPFGGILNESFNRVDYQNKLYNGKEYDRMHGLNLYDYSARQYDPAIGQFTSIDPLCEKYYHISPYAYCAGNPVKYVDPDDKAINLVLGAVGAVADSLLETGIAVYQGKSSNEIIGAAVRGAIEGGAIGLTMGASVAVSASVSVGASVAGSVAEQGISKGAVNIVDVGVDAIAGGLSFGVGSVGSAGLKMVSKSAQKAVEKHYANGAVRESIKKAFVKENGNLNGLKRGSKMFKNTVNSHIKTLQDADKCFIRGTKKALDYGQQQGVSKVVSKGGDDVKNKLRK